ncbi:unnamed protein product [Ilex paraguariensis]|uniref:Uncharacterized protein n=1 Tax=Ilex paraguariensis TaxID=185542 RepID=A0ABC8UPA0_9AQUA
MEEDVERHQLIRDSLEQELQALRQRLLAVENFTENMDSVHSNAEQLAENQLTRTPQNLSVLLHEAHNRIRVLLEERAEQAKEIKQYKDYVRELVLHAEAQASQYQEKYKTLEAMVCDVKTDSSKLTSTEPKVDKTERSSMKTRGSSSPFRCIASLVQLANLEKDQELLTARLHLEELESLAASRQKEVCMLNARLVATENMTHDVIRDLLGVKLDMTNYANLIDHYQLQKAVEGAQQQMQESTAMEQEIINLKRQIDELMEERERQVKFLQQGSKTTCRIFLYTDFTGLSLKLNGGELWKFRLYISEVNRREVDIFDAHMTVEHLEERDQLLTQQNKMLKVDKFNLQKKVAELDEMVKKLFGTQSIQPRNRQQMSSLSRSGDTDLGKRLANSEKLLLRVNDELAQYHISGSGSSRPHMQTG